MPTLRPDKGRPLAGPRSARWETDRLQNVPSRKKIRTTMAGRKKWEEEQLVKALQEEKTRTDLEMLMAWGMIISPMPSKR